MDFQGSNSNVRIASRPAWLKCWSPLTQKVSSVTSVGTKHRFLKRTNPRVPKKHLTSAIKSTKKPRWRVKTTQAIGIWTISIGLITMGPRCLEFRVSIWVELIWARKDSRFSSTISNHPRKWISSNLVLIKCSPIPPQTSSNRHNKSCAATQSHAHSQSSTQCAEC